MSTRNWPKTIKECKFLLDVVRITIDSDDPKNIGYHLSKSFKYITTVSESKTKHPILKEKFESRSYYEFGNISQLYLVHNKKVAWQNISALLVLHDVSLLDLVLIGKELEKIPSIKSFHFSYIEFRWDIYPKLRLANKLQEQIVRNLFLENARQAPKPYVSKNRKTYYINKQPCDFQVIVYVRPKIKNLHRQEFVRLELKAKTDWLQRLGLFKPFDFEKLCFNDLAAQIQWLSLNMSKVRQNQLNVLTGGKWMAQVKHELEMWGLAKLIIEHKKEFVCPPFCKMRGHKDECLLTSAYRGLNRVSHVLRPGYRLVSAIRECECSKPCERFQRDTCKPYLYKKGINSIMRDAYNEWALYPSFA
jgi:hypothetical protein